jgi:hypothetical protein
MGRRFESCRAHQVQWSSPFRAILVIPKRLSCYNHRLMFLARDFIGRFVLVALLIPCCAALGVSQSKPDGTQTHSAVSDLDNATVVSALKQALEISSTKAIAETGKHDGFLQNEAIRILLPPKLQSIGKSMRMLGMGDQVDELEIGMNRAAENATPQAKPIFLAAVKNLVLRDPRLVLTSGDTAATEYFRGSSTADLSAAFTPIVHRAMEHLGVIRQYKRVLKTDPGGNAIASEFDLDQYVVEQTLNGIFEVMASEESNIRSQPAAQNSDVIKIVFSGAK